MAADDPWDRLDRALAARGGTGFWWRDDDARGWTPALERLAGILSDVPFALAVVPDGAAPDLPGRILQHGWTHANHAPPGEKRAEFGPHRPTAEMRRDLLAGRDRLRDLYGDRFPAVLAPPWNRIDPTLAAGLPDMGYAGLSTFRAPAAPFDVPAHVDPIDWRGTRGFRGEATVLDDLVEQLDRVEGPVGVLSHHLASDEDGFAFLAELARFVSGACEARWLDPCMLWAG